MFDNRFDYRNPSSDVDLSHIPASRNLVFRAKEGGLVSKDTFIGPAHIPARRTITRSAPTPVVPAIVTVPVAVVVAPEIVTAPVAPEVMITDDPVVPSKVTHIEVKDSEIVVIAEVVAAAETVPSRKLTREEIVAMMDDAFRPKARSTVDSPRPQPIRQESFGPAPKLIARGDRRAEKFKKSAPHRKTELLKRAEALHRSCFDYEKAGPLLRQRFGHGRSDMFCHLRSDLHRKIAEAEDFSDLGKIEKYLGQMEELSIEFRKADPA